VKRLVNALRLLANQEKNVLSRGRPIVTRARTTTSAQLDLDPQARQFPHVSECTFDSA